MLNGNDLRLIQEEEEIFFFLLNDEEEESQEDPWLEVFTPAESLPLVQVWANYAQAMRRRRPESILDEDRFIRHVQRDDTHALRHGRSVIFGGLNEGVFMPSHFAPSSIREGVELFKKLGEGCLPVVLCVTEDLVAMAEKSGFTDTGIQFPVSWRDEIHVKHVLANTRKALEFVQSKLEEMTGH
jgi:hypothetical protein